MNKFYYRVTYNGVGVYDAFKRKLWEKSNTPKEDWIKLKNSDVFSWLKIPEINYENCYSYFTKIGYQLFKNNTYQLFLEYLDKDKIEIKKYKFNKAQLDILYEDEHQIVVKNNCSYDINKKEG